MSVVNYSQLMCRVDVPSDIIKLYLNLGLHDDDSC